MPQKSHRSDKTVLQVKRARTKETRVKISPRRIKILCKIPINMDITKSKRVFSFNTFISLNVKMIPGKTSVSLHETLNYHLMTLFSQLNVGLRRYLKIL